MAEDKNIKSDNTEKNMEEGLQWIAREVPLQEVELKSVFVGDAPTLWEIDFDKVKTVQDINTLLQAITVRFTSHHNDFDNFKHLLKRSLDDNENGR